MIPKIIHYCWFGGDEMPEEYQAYVKEWAELHPEWEITRWDEHNYRNEIPYIKAAMAQKNWANVSNLVRLQVLEEFGGIYLDTDVKLLKNLDNFCNYDCFLGFENEEVNPALLSVNNAVIGSAKSHSFIKKCITYLVENFDGHEPANESSPKMITHLLQRDYGLKSYGQQKLVDNITLFPKNVFYPIPWNNVKHAKEYESSITDETVAVHMWGRTWYTKKMMLAIIDELQSWTKEQENYIKGLKNHVEHLEASNKHIITINGNLKTEISKQKLLLSEEKKLHTEQIKKNDETQISINECKNQIQQLEQSSKAINIQKSNLESEVNEQKLLLNQQKKLYTEQIKKNDEAEIIIKERSDQLSLLKELWQNTARIHRDIINQKDIKIAELEATIHRHAEELKKSLHYYTEVHGSLKQEIGFKESTIFNLRTDAKKMEKEIRDINNNLNSVQEAIQQLNLSLYLLTESNKKGKETIANLENANANLSMQVKDLKMEIVRLSREKEINNMEIKEKNNAISWYQRTYEHRSLLGVVKEKFLKNNKPHK